MTTLSQAAAARTRARGENFKRKMELKNTELELQALEKVINEFEKDLSLIGIDPWSLMHNESNNKN